MSDDNSPVQKAKQWPVVSLAGALFLIAPGASMSARLSTASFCEVIGGAKLSSQAGGANEICSMIRQAAGGHAVGKAHVTVRVLSNTRLSATIVNASGKTLPRQNFAVQDAQLDRTHIAQFARVIANVLFAGER